MLHLQRIHTHHPHYPFVEALLHSAFPEAERRDDLEQREQTDHHPLFHCYLVTDTDGKTEEQPVGLVTVWRLEGFSYVEHLATSATVRNQGYGRRILEALRKEVQGLLILEVEPPTNEMSRRRIGFYRRCGFSLCELPYLQPPYRKGDHPFPLLLMFDGADSIDASFDHIRRCIYRIVYRVADAL